MGKASLSKSMNVYSKQAGNGFPAASPFAQAAPIVPNAGAAAPADVQSQMASQQAPFMPTGSAADGMGQLTRPQAPPPPTESKGHKLLGAIIPLLTGALMAKSGGVPGIVGAGMGLQAQQTDQARQTAQKQANVQAALATPEGKTIAESNFLKARPNLAETYYKNKYGATAVKSPEELAIERLNANANLTNAGAAAAKAKNEGLGVPAAIEDKLADAAKKRRKTISEAGGDFLTAILDPTAGDSPQPTAQQASPPATQPPAGATHIKVYQGKKYFTDAQGNNLGEAP